METIKLRKELHSVIDILPNRNLKALKPVMLALIDEPLVIETDLSDEERQWIAEGDKKYAEHPEEFVRLEDVL